MQNAARRLLYEELRKLPENRVGEIIDGELFSSPRPASPHAHAAFIIAVDIGSRFEGPVDGLEKPGGWWILFEPELHLAEDVVVPDIAGWRRERMPSMERVNYFTQAPDWVCEVLSPSSAHLDRVRKMRLYAREGVSHLWLVDPVLHTLEVYRLSQGGWVVVANFGGDDTVQAEPFASAPLALRRCWLD